MHFTRKGKVKKDMSLTRLCFDRGFRKGVTPIPCCSFHPGTIWGILLRSPHLSCIRYCYSHNFFCQLTQLCKLSTSVDTLLPVLVFWKCSSIDFELLMYVRTMLSWKKQTEKFVSGHTCHIFLSFDAGCSILVKDHFQRFRIGSLQVSRRL